MKKYNKENCNNIVFSKGFCKFHAPHKKQKKTDFNTEDLESLSLSELKRTADYWLRQYLLKSAEKINGKIYCPIKNKWYSEDKMHVCHYIDRGKSMWTRYDLKNCHLLSAESNTWDAQIPYEGYKSKHHFEYEIYLKSLYSDDVIDELTNLSNKKDVFTKNDYINVINELKNGC